MVSRFKLLLQNINLTAAEFASRIGVQRSSVSHVLSGRNKPSIDFLEKILKAFPEVNAGWLITGDGNWKSEIRSEEYKEEKPGPESGKTVLRSVAEAEVTAKSVEADHNITETTAIREERPVDHIIIVYKDNTFRLLNPPGNPV